MNEKYIKRFWSKVKVSLGCWEWQASLRNKGYGAFVWKDDTGKEIQGRAHRFAYELLVGTIPEGMDVLHRCDNPPCVRPDHLFLGTIADNNRDMCEKGRHVPGGTYTTGNYKRGINHHASKLTPDLVREIRQEYNNGGTSYSQLSLKYHIAIGALWRVVNRKAWKEVL